MLEETIQVFSEASDFESSRTGKSGAKVTTVLIPVYGAREHVHNCLRSLAESRKHNQSQFEILVIDDRGPDGLIGAELSTLAKLGFIQLIQNAINLGFPATCNIGFEKSGDNDVVILNSDAIVYNNWIDRLEQIAGSDPTIGTITPLTNDGEIASYPIWLRHNEEGAIAPSEIDLASYAANSLEVVDVPTGVGFCMFISRELLDKAGGFDIEAFGKGYGEENDLCRRAFACGLRNVIAPGIYVSHVGSQSFGTSKTTHTEGALSKVEERNPGYVDSISTFISADPLKKFRRNLDIQILRNRTELGSILLLSHSRGGGTERAVREAAELFELSGYNSLIARAQSSGSSTFEVRHMFSEYGGNIGSFDIGTDLSEFEKFASAAKIERVEIHHWIDFTPDFPIVLRKQLMKIGVPYTVRLHDYYSICPRVHLADETMAYCGLPSLQACQACVLRQDENSYKPSIFAWIEQSKDFLLGAELVTCPSLDTKTRLERRIPDAQIQVEPNWLHSKILKISKSDGSDSIGSPVVLILGAISEMKGASILREVVKTASERKSELRFKVVGYTSSDMELEKLGNIEILGKYSEEDLEGLIAEVDPALAWFPGVIPETFSYALSELLSKSTVPISCFDLGAISDRILNSRRGWVMPLSLVSTPGIVVDHLERYADPNMRKCLC